MHVMKPLALAIGAALSPFGIVTIYLLGSRLLPDAIIFPLWLGVLIFGTMLGVMCLFGLTGNGRRRLVLSLVYVPVMLLTSVVYSFYVTGAILGGIDLIAGCHWWRGTAYNDEPAVAVVKPVSWAG